MTEVSEPDWVIRRDGSAHEVLTKDGTWGSIDEAQWFATQHEALDALAANCPPGTTGTPQQQHPDAHD